MTILLFGDINLDVTLHVPAYPEAGRDAIVQEVNTRLGGSIANTAIALAGLGLPVRLVGRAGQDAAGDQAIAGLQSAGIDTSLIQRDPSAPTGQIFIVVSADGERTMFSARGANQLISPESLPVTILDGVDRLHLSTYSFLAAPQKNAALQLVLAAGASGIPCSLDIADGHAARLGTELAALAPRFDLLFLNPNDAAALLALAKPEKSESMIAALLKQGIKLVALKLSAQGSLVGTQETIHTLPALPAVVVDTTGAGDAYAAGLIFGQHTGHSLLSSAWIASAMGALATTVRGAGTALPGRTALIAYIAALPETANQGGWRESMLAQLGSGDIAGLPAVASS